MKQREGLIKRFQPTTALAGAVWLVVVVVVVFGLLTPVALAVSQANGVLALGVAAAICLLGGLAGSFLAVVVPGLNPGYGMLLGMLPRMGVPLLLGMLVYHRAGHLADAGFIYYLLLFYLVMLAVEVWTAAGQAGSAAKS